ncbi:MAG: hypothetical protein IMX06_02780 [Kyrpidia tusciae]|nr:hypothetical protein [Kyrpidia tusciae]MBE3551775.1 hypothetical protein [Kyrpidia tusciae]
MRPKTFFWTFVGLVCAGVLLIYGLPRLPQPDSPRAATFAAAWMALALLALGSFLYRLMEVDRERRAPDRVPLAVRRAASRQVIQLSRRDPEDPRKIHRDYM